MPGTALLGPVFTGAKTGSAYQASISFGTGKIIDEIKQSEIFIKPDTTLLTQSFVNKQPAIHLSYKKSNNHLSDF